MRKTIKTDNKARVSGSPRAFLLPCDMDKDRITLEEFSCLSLEQRAQYLLSFGCRMTTKLFPKFAFTLYQMEDFFVEVIYNKEDNHIQSIEGFYDTEYLMGYVEDFPINHIL
ncbi:hypothetical protein [Catalinimonas alkaloidigena]|uniref:hypothetical protein n=1 Tax=Catalinimonas alkaloidigena TaxID=1075417 RepID=UPI00240559CA|nr:hypothetical protein [Catalinimonas alkaloidigena]